MKKILLLLMLCMGLGLVGCGGKESVKFDKEQVPTIEENIDTRDMSNMFLEKYVGSIYMSDSKLDEYINNDRDIEKFSKKIIDNHLDDLCLPEVDKVKIFRFNIYGDGNKLIGDLSILVHESGSITGFVINSIPGNESSREFEL